MSIAKDLSTDIWKKNLLLELLLKSFQLIRRLAKDLLLVPKLFTSQFISAWTHQTVSAPIPPSLAHRLIRFQPLSKIFNLSLPAFTSSCTENETITYSPTSNSSSSSSYSSSTTWTDSSVTVSYSGDTSSFSDQDDRQTDVYSEI